MIHRRASVDDFTLTQQPVDAPLDRFADRIWSVTWDRTGFAPIESAVIPAPSVNVTIEWSDESGDGCCRPTMHVHGVVTGIFDRRLTGSGGAVGVRFRPGGFAAWLGRPIGHLTDRVVDAGSILTELSPSAVSSTLEAAPEDRAWRLAKCLAACAPSPSTHYLQLTDLLERMEHDASLQRVEQLSDVTGWSRRKLQRVFRDEVGATPKWVLARHRLQDAALLLEQEPTADLADVAVQFGWYDQAHFTNEFRRTLGVTPASYRRRAAD